jgi:D-tyrosyl-tRNA(Tyr) deacylase
MMAVLQRVSRASVTTGGNLVSSIGRGLCLLIGIESSDTLSDVRALTNKVGGLRIFPDDEGRMNRSVLDIGGEILVVSQFTLLGDVRRGRRPSFSAAADQEFARPMIEEIVVSFRRHGIMTSVGDFGAHMEVELVNDGPVTMSMSIRKGRVE